MPQFSSPDCDDITADVIIADPSTDSADVTDADPSCCLLILLTSSLLITACCLLIKLTSSSLIPDSSNRNADVIISVWKTLALTVEYTVAVTDGVYDVTVSDNPAMHISVDSNFNRDLLLYRERFIRYLLFITVIRFLFASIQQLIDSLH
ncbi:hypothetical protein F511_39273 [Dorcoceras hygrometricum]|uniref:Uncharacterized protein n=1 Tax=Dorcoceras hygrometricum TaxID=472368 RepID=A0A2Z7AG30_9LAMI|nr:hypothetical protein F511_39273 [Dorcoceras hygrometricum]